MDATHTTTSLNTRTYAPPPAVRSLYKEAAVVGVLGIVALLVGVILAPEQFFRSYLFAYMFWLGLALGSLAILMVQHLSGGAWGIVTRRMLESAAATVPLLAVLFIPIALSFFTEHHLYEWAAHDAPAGGVGSGEVGGLSGGGHDAIRHKLGYLNSTFFIIRALIYFVIWSAMALLLNKWSTEQDRTGDPSLPTRMRNLSGPGIVVYALTITFASVDWIMSLAPEWTSTIFGILTMGGQGLSAMAFMIVMAAWLIKREPFASVYKPRHFHDLGKLLLAFTMLWTYFAFSQLLIIYSGNLPEEIPWYLDRLRGGWQYVAFALVLFQFALPFALLLSRDLKRNANRLVFIAALAMFMRLVDNFWMVEPQFHKANINIGLRAILLDIAAPIAIGGIWLAAFAWRLSQRPLLPVNDPYLADALNPKGH
ncbi:MAG: hypothetical protein ABR577_12270 [Pyrinomonadaceae bacterium]